jgi:hypothetical protein
MRALRSLLPTEAPSRATGLVSLAAVAFSVAMLGGSSAVALETDPYMGLDVELEDSAPALNHYVNEVIERRLDRMNRRLNEGRGEALLCDAAVERVFRGFMYMRASGWAQRSPGVDRFPDRDVGRIGYYRQSVLGFPYYAFFQVPLARTINVGGVHVSADKLGHFFAFGLRYNRKYKRARSRGLSEEDAERVAILWGLRRERTVQGLTSTGIASYADLEANYQGMRLMQDLCGSGGSARLVRDSVGHWSLQGRVDLRDYVNPDWDEWYNPNFYAKRRWKNIRKRMAEHCDKLGNDAVAQRLRRYARDDSPSANARVIEELESRQRLPRRQRFQLGSVCDDVASRAPTRDDPDVAWSETGPGGRVTALQSAPER